MKNARPHGCHPGTSTAGTDIIPPSGNAGADYDGRGTALTLTAVLALIAGLHNHGTA